MDKTTICLKKLLSLRVDEISFIYGMIKKYSPSKKRRRKIKNNHENQDVNNIIDESLPKLLDMNDPKWETCTDQGFLYFRHLFDRIKKHVDNEI